MLQPPGPLAAAGPTRTPHAASGPPGWALPLRRVALAPAAGGEPVDPDAAALLPARTSWMLRALPFTRQDGLLLVAMADPFDAIARSVLEEDLAGRTDLRLAFAACDAGQLSAALEAVHGPVPLDALEPPRGRPAVPAEEAGFAPPATAPDVPRAARRRSPWWRVMGGRRRPFHSRVRSAAAAVLSLLALALLAVYLVVPAPAPVCGTECAAPGWLAAAYDVAAVVILAISAYFVTLFLSGFLNTRRARYRPSARRPFFVLVTPARNEALVIQETVRRLLSLNGERHLTMVLDDGSTDDTAALARAAAGDDDDRLLVVERDASIAGRGKGDVLNHAYRLISHLAHVRSPMVGGRGPQDVVLCVVDADGWLEPDALEAVASYFDDPRVAGVQVPVRMWNARDGFFAFLQDMEFIGFSLLVQGGRDRIGSAGLGGNGQFVRVDALDTLGPEPWTRSLTEDLDIGLSLVKRGWRNRMCPLTYVAQQAVTRPRALLRQRTRWTQGHYTCWSHIPGLWRSRLVPRLVALDLTLHLVLAVTVLLVTFQAVVGLLSFFGIVPVGQSVIHDLAGSEVVYRILVLVMAVGPLTLLTLAYQRAAVSYLGSPEQRVPAWAVPGLLLAYCGYVYFWGVPSALRAFGRILLRRDAWAKTAREPLRAPATVG